MGAAVGDVVAGGVAAEDNSHQGIEDGSSHSSFIQICNSDQWKILEGNLYDIKNKNR